TSGYSVIASFGFNGPSPSTINVGRDWSNPSRFCAAPGKLTFVFVRCLSAITPVNTWLSRYGVPAGNWVYANKSGRYPQTSKDGLLNPRERITSEISEATSRLS